MGICCCIKGVVVTVDKMPIFGWSRNSSDDDLPRTDERRPPMDANALPPPDPSVRELEILLAQAKVGTHEFAAVAAAAAASQNIAQQQSQDHHHPREEYTQQQHMPGPEAIPLPPSSDDEESSTEREDVVIIRDSASSSSSEGSGVLVDPPSDIVPGAVSDDPAAEAATQDLALVATEIDDEPEQTTTLAVFRTPKLRFFTEEKSIPAQLNNLQQQSIRKRHEFQNRIHDLDCKVALLTAKLADESMDLDLDLRHAMETGVYKPLEAAFERVSMERFTGGSSATSLSQHWMTLERRLSALDSQMTHSVHVQLQDAKREHLTSLCEELVHDLIPDWKEESAAADKRETATARRWESQAGTMARRFEEERATRVAMLAVSDKKLHELDPRRGEELLTKIAALRKQLAQERAARIASDERIRNYIVTRTEAMKQAILEAYPDPDI
jgi:hypothetical protein